MQTMNACAMISFYAHWNSELRATVSVVEPSVRPISDELRIEATFHQTAGSDVRITMTPEQANDLAQKLTAAAAKARSIAKEKDPDAAGELAGVTG